jgi:hypothetical protein
VVVSFVGEARRVALDGIAGGRWRARVGTHLEPSQPNADGVLDLRPDEALVLEAIDG